MVRNACDTSQEDECEDDDTLPDAPAASGQTVSGEPLESVAPPTGTPSLRKSAAGPMSSDEKPLSGNGTNLFDKESSSPKIPTSTKEESQVSSIEEEATEGTKHLEETSSRVSNTEKTRSVGSSSVSDMQTPGARTSGFGTFDESKIGTPTMISLPVASNDGFNDLLSSIGDKEKKALGFSTQEATSSMKNQTMLPITGEKAEAFDTKSLHSDSRYVVGDDESGEPGSTSVLLGRAQSAVQGQQKAGMDQKGPRNFCPPENTSFVSQGDKEQSLLVGTDIHSQQRILCI